MKIIEQTVLPDKAAAEKMGSYRWRICALLFFATTINYIDRQVLGILAPQLQAEFGWSEKDYGFIISAFQLAYGLGFVGMGYLLDRFGTRIGYTIAIITWSLAAISHAFGKSVFSFASARFLLGFGEAGNFPAALKTVSEWFPKKERALAIGIFNSGSNIGAIFAPLLVPFIALQFGWEWAFIITGALGFIWVVFWLISYRIPAGHPKLSSRELAFIESDQEKTVRVKVSWMKLLTYRESWAFAAAKFLTDPVWWFYLYWLPKYLHSEHGLSLDKIGLPLIVIYLVSDAGSIAGGWMSSKLIKMGVGINYARKITMFLCASLVLPVFFIPAVSELWIVVAVLSLATAAHQGWSANLFSTVTDLFPGKAVGSVTGLGGLFGAAGGMLIAILSGYILEWTGSYTLLFVIACFNYLIAFAIFHLLVPKINTITLKTDA